MIRLRAFEKIKRKEGERKKKKAQRDREKEKDTTKKGMREAFYLAHFSPSPPAQEQCRE